MGRKYEKPVTFEVINRSGEPLELSARKIQEIVAGDVASKSAVGDWNLPLENLVPVFRDFQNFHEGYKLTIAHDIVCALACPAIVFKEECVPDDGYNLTPLEQEVAWTALGVVLEEGRKFRSYSNGHAGRHVNDQKTDRRRYTRKAEWCEGAAREFLKCRVARATNGKRGAIYKELVREGMALTHNYVSWGDELPGEARKRQAEASGGGNKKPRTKRRSRMRHRRG